MTARQSFSASVVAAVLAFAVPTFAQKPSDAPKNATAQCTDGTFSTAKTQQGACSQHGGVKLWWGAGTVVAPAPIPPKSTPTVRPRGASSSKSGTAGRASVPKGATGQCNDGSYTRAKTQCGACSRHGGVKTWFGGKSSSTASTPTNTRVPKTAASPPPTQEPPNVPPTPPSSAAKAPTKSPANAPGATAKCKDGTYSYAKQHRGACSRHGGVAEWYK